MSEGLDRRKAMAGIGALLVSTKLSEAQSIYPEIPLVLEIKAREDELLGPKGRDIRLNAFRMIEGQSLFANFEYTVGHYKPQNIPEKTWAELRKILIGLPAQESRFDPSRKNKISGATGMCQITQTALNDLSEEFDLPELKLAQMHSPNIATNTMLEVLDKSLYIRLENMTNLLTKAFGLDENQSATFQAYTIINAYNVGPSAMNQIFKSFSKEVTESKDKNFTNKIEMVLATQSGSDLFDLIRNTALAKEYNKYFKREAHGYLANVVAAANMLNNTKSILTPKS